MLKHKIVICLAFLLTIACSSPRSATAPQNTEVLEPQREQVWQLVAERGRDIKNGTPITTLSFNPEAGTFRGHSACNVYHGEYRLQLEQRRPEGDMYAITVNFGGCGNVRCPEADMNAEQRFTSLLPKADHMLVSAYELKLFQRGKELLKFELQ